MITADLVDNMGSDLSIVNAARVTMGVSHEELTDGDSRLIAFLAREKHVTPFRHPTITLRCKAPIAIARQLGKHQVGFSWNEMSRRYKDGNVEYYTPEEFHSRPQNLHAGSGEAVVQGSETHTGLVEVFESIYASCDKVYRGLLEAGLAPEQARLVLPQGMVTEWIWTGSLYGWFEVYRQRSSHHAQYEVQLFAKEVDAIMSSLYPIAWMALKSTLEVKTEEPTPVIQTKKCKQCGCEGAVGMLFKPCDNSDDGFFPLCNACIQINEQNQDAKWQQYYQPNSQPNLS